MPTDGEETGAASGPGSRPGQAASGAGEEPAPAAPRTFWTRSFFLVWQGQLVSSLGDIVYALALGFWVLKVTGSTALMGTLMAATTLPRVLVAPFAGVVADRSDRKSLMIWMELLRGFGVTLVGVAAFGGWLHIWMVFGAGIVIGLGGAFFGPSLGACIPDLVHRDKLVQANSALQLVATGSGVFGSALGGLLYQALGAATLFLFNGLSYLFSAFMLAFARVPRVVRGGAPTHFMADMRDGMRLSWEMRGLRVLLLGAAILNFFAVMGITLFLPLFHQTEGLGPARYGVLMGCLGAGMFAGFAGMSLIAIRPALRFRVFYVCSLTFSAAMIALPLAPYPVMLGLGVLTGIGNAVVNALIQSLVMLTVPGDMRGKVFGLLGSITGALTPLGMAFGGVLAEFVPVRSLISICFVVTFLVFVPMAASASFRKFINLDPSTAKTSAAGG